MENLNRRLESLQDALLTLYEEGRDDIDTQIKHWSLIRKEQVLLHYARQQGILSLGYRAVPSLAASKRRAKDAIEQMLYLESIKNSAYGSEQWTLLDTSRERLNAAPANTFKKGGEQVDIVFDNNPENKVRHVLWGAIYYQTENGWKKVPGKIDKKGLYFLDECEQPVYYVEFEEEAKKYARTLAWEVLVNNKPITPPSPSARDLQPFSGGDGHLTPSPAKHPAASPSACPSHSAKIPLTQPTLRRRRRRLAALQHTPQSARQRQGESPGTRGRLHEPRRRQRESFPPSPGEVGKAHTTVEGGSGGRLGRLLREARDPPALILKGKSNPLKCLRYRLHNQHPTLFVDISTTWQWTSTKRTATNGACIIVLFTDDSQRDYFVKHVRIPKTIQMYPGSLFGV